MAIVPRLAASARMVPEATGTPRVMARSETTKGPSGQPPPPRPTDSPLLRFAGVPGALEGRR
jgi:hypothetical protein